MDEHRITGTARAAGGKIEESFGRAAGDNRMEVQGAAERAQGRAEQIYGRAADAAGETVAGARATARSIEDTVRDTIENRPYVAAALALGIGWLLGRTHRPL